MPTPEGKSCCACGHTISDKNVVPKPFPVAKAARSKIFEKTQPAGVHRKLTQRRPPITSMELDPWKLALQPCGIGLVLGLRQFEQHWVCDGCHTNAQERLRQAFKLKLLMRVAVYALSAILVALCVAWTSPTREPWRDTAILIGAWAVALAHLFLAYERGGRVWVLRHGLIAPGTTTDLATSIDVPGLAAVLDLLHAGRNREKGANAAPASRFERGAGRRIYRGWVFRRRFRGTPLKALEDVPIAADVSAEGPLGGPAPADELLWQSCISGFWGEAIIVSAAIAICIVIAWMCSIANIIVVLQSYPISMGLLGLIVAIVVADYSSRQVQVAEISGHKSSFRGKLADAYSEYAVYSWFLFAFGAVILGLLLFEFRAHEVDFQREKATILHFLTSAVSTAQTAHRSGLSEVEKSEIFKHAMSFVEAGYGHLTKVDTVLQDQLNPVFIFAALLILINIVIAHTGLKSLFADDARSYTFVFTYVPLILVIAVGALIYVNSYHVLMSSMQLYLERAFPDGSVMDPEVVKRHSEILGDIVHRSNVFGFAAAIGGVGSGAPLFLWFIKEVLDRLASKEALEEVAGDVLHQPRRRFRPAEREKREIRLERATKNTLKRRKSSTEAAT